MSINVYNLINDFKKILVTHFSSVCCPRCGALISPNATHCEYCEAPSPRVMTEKLVEKMETYLSSFLPAVQLKEAIKELKKLIPDIKNQAERLSNEIEENLREILVKKLDIVWKEARENVAARLMQVEDDITQLMYSIYNNLRTNPLKEIRFALTPQTDPKEVANIATTAEQNWNLTKIGVSESIIAEMETSASMRKTGDFLYRAGKFNEALKWYARALTAIMYPQSSPQNSETTPRYAIGEYIPFGALKLENYDVNFDGKQELIYIPSREIGGLNILGAVINKGGYQWPETRLKGIIIPLLGVFPDNKILFANWENPRLYDAKIVTNDGEPLTIKRSSETITVIPSYDFLCGDVDGDEETEIVALTYPAGIAIYKYNGECLEEVYKRVTGKICAGILADINGDGKNEIIIVSSNGQITAVSLETPSKTLISEGTITDPITCVISVGRILNEDADEIYITSQREGILQLTLHQDKLSIVRISSESPISLTIAKTRKESKPHLITLNYSLNGLNLSFFSVEEVLGVASISKLFEIPLYLPEPIEIKRGKNLCSGDIRTSRNIAKSLDIDNDSVDEFFFAFEKTLIGIDLKF